MRKPSLFKHYRKQYHHFFGKLIKKWGTLMIPYVIFRNIKSISSMSCLLLSPQQRTSACYFQKTYCGNWKLKQSPLLFPTLITNLRRNQCGYGSETMQARSFHLSNSLGQGEIALSNDEGAGKSTPNNDQNDDLFRDPLAFHGQEIPRPKSLSPSSAKEFLSCPQSYLFQYLYKIKQPTNTALAKGSMCHSALEKLFDLNPSQRTLENLENLFRCAN
mmetsp:Transcript_53212/g.64108  ORF Transcript_53212/g.64108 Transcript_53212/m.64108 type:complete len:217 (+) Transcript_53212:3-653(+)